MKTTEEINELNRNWASDPCWDIEDTEGFEDHYEELKEYRLKAEKNIQMRYANGVVSRIEWDERRYETSVKLAASLLIASPKASETQIVDSALRLTDKLLNRLKEDHENKLISNNF